MEDYKLILDVIVAILLAATIGYAWVLNGRLNDLRRNRDDLARLVNAFNDATQRAEAGIPKLRRAAEEAEAQLQDRVEKAQSLRDDLAFMIERADAMAARLEGTVRTARDVKASAPAAPAAPAPQPQPSPRVSSAMGARASQAAPQPAPQPQPQPQHQPGPNFGFAADDAFEDERSEAERELLRALQSVR